MNIIYEIATGKIVGVGGFIPEDFGATGFDTLPEPVGFVAGEAKNWLVENGVLVEQTAMILARRRARAVLSRSQFCLALRAAGHLTALEAKEAAKGEVPAPLAAALAAAVLAATMTVEESENATILWAGLTQVERVHPIIALVQSFLSLTDAQIDALFGIA
jgi:hypothetical protein